MTSQDRKHAYVAALIVVVIILFVILAYNTVQSIISFYHAHTNWFWTIIALIILAIVGFLLRQRIYNFVYDQLNKQRKNAPSSVEKPDTVKPKVANTSHQKNKKQN